MRHTDCVCGRVDGMRWESPPPTIAGIHLLPTHGGHGTVVTVRISAFAEDGDVLAVGAVVRGRRRSATSWQDEYDLMTVTCMPVQGISGGYEGLWVADTTGLLHDPPIYYRNVTVYAFASDGAATEGREVKAHFCFDE